MPSGHQALALRRADRGAEVGALREAAFALPAFGCVERDHVVADLHRGHACTHLAHDAGALVAKNRRELAFRIKARERVGVRVADAGRPILDQHLAGTRAADLDRLDGQRLVGLPGDGGAALHGGSFLPSATDAVRPQSMIPRPFKDFEFCPSFARLDSGLWDRLLEPGRSGIGDVGLRVRKRRDG